MATRKLGIRLDQAAVARLGRLLHMEYTPAELADELGCNARQIRQTALPQGCPHRRDERDHIWIIGSEFRQWYQGTQAKTRHPMQDDEAWCLRCGRAVVMDGPLTVVPRHGRAELVKGFCYLCGGRVNRLRSRTEEP
jgi:hypothetical protein